MRSYHSKLMALPLIAAGMAMAAAPADATQRRTNVEPQQTPTPAPELSREFRAAAVPVQEAIQTENFEAANAALAAVEAVAATPYEKYVVAKFKLSIATNRRDSAAQYEAIDSILAGGQATGQELANLYFYSGNFAYASADYTKAADRLANALQLGYTKNNVPLMLADSYMNLQRLDDAFQVMRQGIATKRAAGETIPEDWFNRPAAAAQQAGRNDVLMEFLTMRLQSHPTATNWRNGTMIYLTTLKPDKSATLDTLRLMNETGAMQTRSEYFEWAETAVDSGLPGEAVRAYQAGINAGHVQSSDSQFGTLARVQESATSADRADLASAGGSAASAANGVPARATADAWLGYSEYDKAIPLYRLALQKGGVDAGQVNTRLGIALAMSGDYAGAKEALSAVTGPRAPLANLWMAYVDQKAATAAPQVPAQPVTPGTTGE